MDTTDLEVLAPKLVEEVKITNRTSGNSFVEATKVMKTLFPTGMAGKEQEAFAMLRILDKMFKIANTPVGSTKTLWQEVAAYALKGIQSCPSI